MIDPRVASGTRDILPALAIQRERIMRRFRETFERCGFAPIDTPVLERREVLYSKGGEEIQRQVFEVAARGQQLEESELALRFDLTVPLARFMARHVDEVGIPFRRYHIGLVYRGERAQRGRYREFYQCDFDIIGSRSAVADAEIGLVIHDGLRAVGVPGFTIRLNNRKILNGLLDGLGLTPHTAHVLRALDKLAKIGDAGVLEELQFGEAQPEPADTGRAAPTERDTATARHDRSISSAPRGVRQRVLSLEDARRVLDCVASAGAGSWSAVLDQLAGRLGSHPAAREGIENLRAVCALLRAGGVGDDAIVVQPGLARGLDYYTGIIFETMVTGHEDYGSVCSGGRYDDLAGLFTERQLPGVGASFGLDRLTQLMADAGWLEQRSTVAAILVINFQESDSDAYVGIAQELRRAEIASELYPDPRPLREQFGYASSRGHRFAVIAGPDEIASQTFALRDMATRKQQNGLPRAELVPIVTAALRA